MIFNYCNLKGGKTMLAAPKIDHYINILKSIPYRTFQANFAYDEKSYKLMDELFELIKVLKSTSDNGAKRLWLKTYRGNIDEFGDYDEWLEEGMCENYDEFKEIWLSYYPNETKWYEFVAVEDIETTFRAVVLGHEYILEDDKREPHGNSFPYEITEFMVWLVNSVKDAIDDIKAGTYNETLNRELPPENKTGTITRKDLWDVFPDDREKFFENLSDRDRNDFVQLAYLQKSQENTDRIIMMTANDFYYYCSLGYKENNYKGYDKSAKEQYYLHADGRDNGLSEIDADSPEEFEQWFFDDTKHGGHPWEVCRGGNSTHISLFVRKDEFGYLLILDGNAWNRTIETVKFYLALVRNNIPVYLNDAELLADRLTEKEKIGIVPQGVIPKYCDSYFPNENIIDFINLPYDKDDTEKMLPYCSWYLIEEIELISSADE